ncbi:tripartite tricarboxylate transporter TctB family protein [Pseudorhodobacter aquimaris]|uniref:tripartite tricarboxylate transporter TctB family protein n=1 Tax=Pseudorhodobacter aquimaris TaxID=687412 RepID=UPI000A6C06B4|nr:tripartite tricarboxylate transporter TctB family protein [Pseudorhodobacter aquimaris]
MRKATIETGASLLVCAISILGFWEASQYAGEGGLMPRGVTALMILLSAIWAVQSVRAMRGGSVAVIAPSPNQLRLSVMLILAGLGLLFGMAFVGFYTSAAVIVPLLGYGLGYRNFRGLAIGTFLFLLLLVSVFRLLLAVPLPPEAVLKMIGL